MDVLGIVFTWNFNVLCTSDTDKHSFDLVMTFQVPHEPPGMARLILTVEGYKAKLVLISINHDIVLKRVNFL